MNPEFETLEAAEAYMEITPAASAIITNTPTPGMFTVTMHKESEYGDYRDLMAAGIRQEKRRELADREVYEVELTIGAMHKVGFELAAELGFSGDSARMFCLGFAGESAKTANPRGLGLESVFRAGRVAKNNGENLRRVRVAAHAFRSEYTFRKFVDLKYQYGPIPYYVEDQNKESPL